MGSEYRPVPLQPQPSPQGRGEIWKLAMSRTAKNPLVREQHLLRPPHPPSLLPIPLSNGLFCLAQPPGSVRDYWATICQGALNPHKPFLTLLLTQPAPDLHILVEFPWDTSISMVIPILPAISPTRRPPQIGKCQTNLRAFGSIVTLLICIVQCLTSSRFLY
jgi:hypothetical protein